MCWPFLLLFLVGVILVVRVFDVDVDVVDVLVADDVVVAAVVGGCCCCRWYCRCCC